MAERIIIKASRADLPLLRDRYPFIYLEHGRLEVDDSSIKWISADRKVFRIPAATISTLLLGPGTSVTHEAIKVLAETNCTVCWVGEETISSILPCTHGGVSETIRAAFSTVSSSPYARGCFRDSSADDRR